MLLHIPVLGTGFILTNVSSPTELTTLPKELRRHLEEMYSMSGLCRRKHRSRSKTINGDLPLFAGEALTALYLQQQVRYTYYVVFISPTIVTIDISSRRLDS